jgi:hypothetical protein
MALPSKTVGISLISSFPVKAFDAVDQGMSRRRSIQSNDSAWRGFAAAWNAVAYRLIAAHRHAERLSELASRSASTPEERFQQDDEMFCWVVAAQSAIECAFFAAEIVTAVASADSFDPMDDGDLRLSVKGIAEKVAQRFPQLKITEVLKRHSAADEFRTLSDLRRVLFHRGTLPRHIHASLGGDIEVLDTMPANPADPGKRWRFDSAFSRDMTDGPQAWCDSAVTDIVLALADITDAWTI